LKSSNIIDLITKKNPVFHNNSNSFSNLKNNVKFNEISQKINQNKINLNLETNIITDYSKKSTPKILNNNEIIARTNSLLNQNFKNSLKAGENNISESNLLIKKELGSNEKPKIEPSSSKKDLDDSLPKKLFASPITNPSKNDKSQSKIEEAVSDSSRKDSKHIVVPLYKDSSSTNPSMINPQIDKKNQSSTNSPKNMSLLFKKNIDKSKQQKKELINKSNVISNSNLDLVKIDESKHKPMINLKLNLNSLNPNKGIKYITKEKALNQNEKANNSFDNVLNTSNCSIRSTIRESNYYKKESDKLSMYIKKCI
jgi:hypothetical protein